MPAQERRRLTIRRRKTANKKTPPHSAKKNNKPSTPKQYAALKPESQERWNRVVHVVSKMRARNVSLRQAAREFGVDPRTVVKLGSSGLQKRPDGRYQAKPADRLLRVLVIPSIDGAKEVVVRGSNKASQIAQYSDAVQRYLRTGDASKLKRFRKIQLKDMKGETISLLTDTAELSRLGSAGVLSFESLYARVA